MEFECVTANLNKGHNPKTVPWLNDLLAQRQPALVFGQELRVGTAETIASEAGYQLIRPPVVDPRWWMGSWIMARKDLVAHQDPNPSWTHFECYVAAARVELPGFGDLRVVSVHASPTRPGHTALSLWGDDLPGGRIGPTGRVNALWHSDLVLQALSAASSDGMPLLAAGDFNESRNYLPPFGTQFFERAAERGLVDVTYSRWGSERQTHFDPRHPQIQVDHVLATPDVDRLVLEPPSVDPLWTSDESRLERSDHAPIWFRISPTPDDPPPPRQPGRS